MPTTSLTFDNQLLTTTLYSIIKELRSMIDRPLPFLDAVESMGKVEEEGGERMVIPLNFDRHSTTTQLSTGYEPINLTVQPLGTPAHDTWGDWIRPVVISGHEERINRGKHKILDILETRAKDTLAGMRLEMQQQILNGNIAAMSDLNTLNGTTLGGFLEEDALGSQSNTVHNVSKGTFSTQLGWQNQIANLGGGGGTYIAAMYGLIARLRELAGEGGGKVKLYAGLDTVITLRGELQDQERYVSGSTMGVRYDVQFAGMPIVECRDVGAVGSTTTKVGILALDHSAIQYVAQSGYHFKTGEFATQSGYDVRASFLHCMGQLRATYLGSSGIAVNP